SPSDLQASQTRGGGGWRGATRNEMEYSSTPDKVAAYEEDELNCKDGDNLRSTRRANRRYPNTFELSTHGQGLFGLATYLLKEDDESLISFPSYYCVINKRNRK